MRFFYFLPLVLLIACSTNNTEISALEKNFNQVADSLIKYKKEIADLNNGIESKLKDFMSLDYTAFKEKYNLSEIQIDELIATYTITYKIGRTTRMIEKNMKNLVQIDTLDKGNRETDYSFDPKGNKPTKSDGKADEYEVLMEAYNEDSKK